MDASRNIAYFKFEVTKNMRVIKSLTRLYVNNIDKAIAYYEKLLNSKCSLHFSYKEVGLELAQIGSFLILAGTDEKLKKFKDTKATLLVDSVIEFKEYLSKHGSEIIRDIREVPTGYNLTMKNPDGVILEYVQFNSDTKID
jgi:predicted enzyme related to lactoylglutathione lyase